MRPLPSNSQVRGRVGAMLVCVVLADVASAGQPVEPPRNPFSADAWQLPSEAPVTLAAPLQTHCQLCHSSDYMATQPPLTKAQWTAIVEKMRGKFGAVIATNQVPGLVEALAAPVSTSGATPAPRCSLSAR